MSIQRYAKRDIVLSQIETALGLFFEGDDFFSVITLAGAAEELLGQLLLQRTGREANRASLRSVFEILRPGIRKRATKEAGDERDDFINTDPYKEAVFLIGRAIDDYQALFGAQSDAMIRFRKEARGGERPGETI